MKSLVFLGMWWMGTASAQDDDQLRQQAADSSFNAIMEQNAYQPGTAVLASPVVTVPVGTEGLWLNGGEVEVSLERYESLRDQIRIASLAAQRSYSTLVVLGSSAYEGRAVPGGLSLKLHVQATLGGPGLWKTVPLVGEEVAVVSARVGSMPVPLTNQNGYQVWVTDQAGEVGIDLEILVPARGPRGSLEYDFLVPKTPVTKFHCSFPGEDLEPKLQGAVREELQTSAGNTELSAWLEPTSRIRVVGFKDLGEENAQPAKVYAEGLHLLSLEENSAEMFTVVRYNILQAGARQFDVQIPLGWTVVSADGEGAFRYTVEEAGPEGSTLHGETAFAIRNNYEISLRLSRSLAEGQPFAVVPPRAMGVEREYGWMAVEVIGNLQLEEQKREQLLALDVSQLPEEMVRSAVSPVLMGYRFHSPGASVQLSATRLPEREPASGSIDAVHATTVIASEGKAMTDLQITLRNRLRHSLRVRLPEGMVVRSSLLDGEAIKPSVAEDGALLLPLKRSKGTDHLEAFTLQLILESDVSAFGLFGWTGLELPAMELPVSSMVWDLSVPSANAYSRLFGAVAPQQFIWGSADWYTPPRRSPVTGEFAGEEVGFAGDSGALPVKIHLPNGGTSLRHERYWIAGDEPVEVQFVHLRGWLRAPLKLLGMLGLTLLAWRWAGEWSTLSRRSLRVMAWSVGGLVLAWMAGWTALGFTGMVSAGAILSRYGGLGALWSGLSNWARTPMASEPTAGSWRAGGVPFRLVLTAGTLALGFWWMLGFLRWVYLLGTPLGG